MCFLKRHLRLPMTTVTCNDIVLKNDVILSVRFDLNTASWFSAMVSTTNFLINYWSYRSKPKLRALMKPSTKFWKSWLVYSLNTSFSVTIYLPLISIYRELIGDLACLYCDKSIVKTYELIVTGRTINYCRTLNI